MKSACAAPLKAISSSSSTIQPAKKRAGYLRKACQIILPYRLENTPAGIVRHIGRDGETAEITTLAQLQDMVLDMFSTVFIGNSQTKVLKDKMVTPRGYVL